ncbi:MAG: AI-2E family transporter [Lacisediminihabitans sp.]
MKIQNAFRFGLFGGLGVLVAIAIGSAVTTLATIITYIGAALFIALGIDPAVSWLERHKFPRWAAILTVLVGILAIVAGLVFAVVPVIVDQTNLLIKQLPDFITTVSGASWIKDTQKSLPSFIDLQSLVDGVGNFFKDPANLSTIGGGVLSVGLGIASGAFGVIIVLILTLYFVASLNSMKRGLYKLVPASKRARFADLAEQISASVGRYVIGQGAIALCNGIASFIFLTFVAKVQYPALFAFIAFLFALIPLVGTLSGSILITLGSLLFNGPGTALWVAIFYLAYMQVEAYVINPRVMTRAVKVPGVVVVIAALAGGALLGILGALIAIPVAASILLIINEVVVPRQNEL